MQSCVVPAMGFFVERIAFKSYIENLCFCGIYFYYVKIPIQQMLHVVLLTVGYKFVNDLENWFSLPWI